MPITAPRPPPFTFSVMIVAAFAISVPSRGTAAKRDAKRPRRRASHWEMRSTAAGPVSVVSASGFFCNQARTSGSSRSLISSWTFPGGGGVDGACCVCATAWPIRRPNPPDTASKRHATLKAPRHFMTSPVRDRRSRCSRHSFFFRPTVARNRRDLFEVIADLPNLRRVPRRA